MPRILVHPLIGIDADGSGVGQPECPPRLHPIREQAVHQSFAQLELERLSQPALQHIEHQQDSRR